MKKTIKQYNGCIGCGACVGLCPQFFKFNDDTFQAELIDGQTQAPTTTGPRANVPFDAREIDASELDADTSALLTGSCCAGVIEVETE